MKKNIIDRNILFKIYAFLIIVSFLSPYIRMHFLIKYDYLLILCFSLVFIIKIVKSKFDRIYLNIFILFSLFLFSFFLSDNIGLYYCEISSNFYFPREIIQIYNRLFLFISFYFIIYRGILTKEKVLLLFSIIAIISLLIGVLQYFQVEIINKVFIDYYSTTDGSSGYLVKWWNVRVFGVLGHPIKWGGIAVLFFFHFYFLCKNSLRVIGCLLALFNILLSGSKAAIAAFIIVAVLYIIIQIIKRRKYKFAYIIVFNILILSIIYLGILGKMDFVIYRFEVFFERFYSNDWGRLYQFQKLLLYFQENLLTILFGIGKHCFDINVKVMEIEPLYFLGTYGVFGFFVYLVFLLFFFGIFIKEVRSFKKESTFAIVALCAYVIFSLGYYFLREINGGYQLYILLGILYGDIKRRKIVG